MRALALFLRLGVLSDPDAFIVTSLLLIAAEGLVAPRLQVHKLMIFNERWITDNLFKPLKNNEWRLNGLKRAAAARSSGAGAGGGGGRSYGALPAPRGSGGSDSGCCSCAIL